MIRFIAVLAVLPLLASNARGDSPRSEPEVGEEYEIRHSYETSERASDGPSGSSSGHNTYLERVIGIREGGLELEYDLPKDATAEDRARNWQFPARVIRSPNGQMQLVNRPELETRLEDWLTAAEWTRDVCGRWIFTWNLFQIECDPESVIETIEELDLRFPDLRDGALYQDSEARGPGALSRETAGPTGETFVVTMALDPGAVHRASAELDVAIGEIMQEPVTLADAMSARSKERVSGTISVRLVTDAEGNVWRRTKVVETKIKGPDGQVENRTATETVERRAISKRAPARQ